MNFDQPKPKRELYPGQNFDLAVTEIIKNFRNNLNNFDVDINNLKMDESLKKRALRSDRFLDEVVRTAILILNSPISKPDRVSYAEFAKRLLNIGIPQYLLLQNKDMKRTVMSQLQSHVESNDFSFSDYANYWAGLGIDLDQL